jgi:hypothetical protein
VNVNIQETNLILRRAKMRKVMNQTELNNHERLQNALKSFGDAINDCRADNSVLP